MNTLIDFNEMVDRVCGPVEPMRPRGFFLFKCFAKPRTRLEKKRGYGEPIWEDTAKNGTTTVGVTAMMNSFWNGTTPTGGSSGNIGTPYIGLIYTISGLSIADTIASHSGWVEFVNYSGNRPAWGQGAAAAGVITNASQVSFTIGNTSQFSVAGAFVCNVASGTSGILWGTSALTGGSQTVSNGQVFQLTYLSTVTPG